MDVIVGVSGETGLFDISKNKMHLNQQVALWFDHTRCIQNRDRDRD